jgi:hypothetical protein
MLLFSLPIYGESWCNEHSVCAQELFQLSGAALCRTLPRFRVMDAFVFTTFVSLTLPRSLAPAKVFRHHGDPFQFFWTITYLGFSMYTNLYVPVS